VKRDYAIIVASGKGLRMGSETPKQFLPVAGRPIVMRTVERFREYSDNLGIILVLPPGMHDYWQKLCEEYHFSVNCMTCEGGETRFHSVRNGLALIPKDAEGVVGVHDGVRPLVPVSVIANCYATAREKKAVVPVVPVFETIRQIVGLKEDSRTVPRDEYRLVQTPQVFSLDLFRKAYEQPYQDSFTDDASVVEAYGEVITLVEGDRENIKITTPIDMAIANAVLGAN